MTWPPTRRRASALNELWEKDRVMFGISLALAMALIILAEIVILANLMYDAIEWCVANPISAIMLLMLPLGECPGEYPIMLLMPWLEWSMMRGVVSLVWRVLRGFKGTTPEDSVNQRRARELKKLAL